MGVRSVNPAAEEVLATFHEFPHRQVDEAPEEAARAIPMWRRTAFPEWVRLVRAAAYVRQHEERLAGLITAEWASPSSRQRQSSRSA